MKRFFYKTSIIILMFLVLLTCSSNVFARLDDGIKSIKLNKSEANICVGQKLQLTAKLFSEFGQLKTSNNNFKWSSSNPAIATVDKNGKVVAKKEGNTTIKAVYTKDTSKTSTAIIRVRNKNNTYKFKKTTYKTAVSKERIDFVLKTIKSKKLYIYKNGILVNFSCKTAETHMALLVGKKVSYNATDIINAKYGKEIKAKDDDFGKNEEKTKQLEIEFYKKIKEFIDKGIPVRITVCNKESKIKRIGEYGQQRVTVVGYKGNCKSINDLLMIGPRSGELLVKTSSNEVCGGLRNNEIIIVE